MKKIRFILVAWLPMIVFLCVGAWDNTRPGDSIAWNVAAGDIRSNNDAIEVVLGIDLSMEGSASPWYQSSAPTTTADGSTALAAGNNGMLWVDSDNQVLYHYVHPSWVLIATGSALSARPSGLEHWYLLNMADPPTLQGLDSQWSLDPNTAAALTITKVEITLDADPTTEFDLDLKFADAFIGLANATLIAAIDTTNGTSNITSFSDATVPAGKVVYLEWGGAPDAATIQGNVKVVWDYD
ncbi:hypothetical protein LCGC14_0358270 [marine sediment metagenome]|uniref:Uncharacterized protein n=1 Tax=marine sediment metagenome TaxID=412755 RepID=A0A0F9VW57_9ZZZZ